MSNPNQYQKASQVPKESIISSLREELSILKDIHNQTVKAGIAGFEAMVAENAVLKVDNELLRHLSFRDERNKLKEQVAKLEEDVAHWKYQADEAGMLRVRYGNTIVQQAEAIRLKDEALLNLLSVIDSEAYPTIQNNGYDAVARQPSPEILQARDERVAEACAKVVDPRSLNYITPGDALTAIRSNEWRKYL